MFSLLFFACAGGSGTDFSNGDATAGETVYNNTCVGCHGDSGDLGVEIGGEPAADLNFEVPKLTDDEMASVIQDGYGTMPAQGMDDTETADVIAYMKQAFGG